MSDTPQHHPLQPVWHRSLAHRMRVLLHTIPLGALHRGDAYRDEAVRHYDSLALALAVMDLIVDHTGLGRDVDRARVTEHLAPLLTAMDAEAAMTPSADRHGRMIDRVIGALRNDEQRRRPFEANYLDVEGNEIVRRVREYRLVYDQFHPDGGTVLRLSNEAINLFLNALDLPIEDAQAAAEAIVQSQLARGRLEEALESARNARVQSTRYRTRIERVLRDTRRDVTSLDWREEVPRLLDEALAHIDMRLVVEQSIITAAKERLDLLDEGDERGLVVAQIAHLVRECMVLHTELQAPLMRSRNVFLDEQARQRFVAPPLQPRPELPREVIEPVLQMPMSSALAIVEAVQPLFFGARAPALLSLENLIEWQLRPRREAVAPPTDVEPADLAERGLDPTRFPPEIREYVESLIMNLRGPVLLSTLLGDARAAGASTAAVDALAIFVTESFARERGSTASEVERAVGAVFDTEGWYGDDVIVSPQGDHHA